MNSIIISIIGILGAALTFFVSSKLKQGPVRASALLSLCVGLFFYLFPYLLNDYLSKHIPLVFIGASFIGMVSTETKVSYIRLIISGLLFSIIYSNSSRYFEGYGGSLGAMALISLLATMGIFILLSKNSKINSLLNQLRKLIYPNKYN